MTKLIFHPDIHLEIKDSYKWYELQAQGLGEAFLDELDSAFEMIRSLPETWPVISRNFRRYLLNRFPFGVIYQIKDNGIFIVGVMHLSRKPDYWKNRV